MNFVSYLSNMTNGAFQAECIERLNPTIKALEFQFNGEFFFSLLEANL